MSAQAQAAIFDWQEGARRLAAATPHVRRGCEIVIDAVHGELRRRLGTSFTVTELADEYAAAHGWFLQLAVQVAPKFPEAHDSALSMDAAFARFMRRAQDATLW